MVEENPQRKDQNQLDENLEVNRPQDTHFHYQNFLGYPFFGTYEPWYDDRKDYNTDAPSYYDYLAHRNYNNRLVIELLNRVARRNITVTDTASVDMTKTNDWISEDACNHYHDVIDLRADVKLSKQTTSKKMGSKRITKEITQIPNATKIFDDGVYTPDYADFIDDLYNISTDLDDKINKEIEDRKEEDKKLNNKIDKEISDRQESEKNLESRLTEKITQLKGENEKLKATLEKIINNLKNSGAWQGDFETGNFADGRNIATGNINLFGGTPDGNHFIRTNNGQTEDDLAGGI